MKSYFNFVKVTDYVTSCFSWQIKNKRLHSNDQSDPDVTLILLRVWRLKFLDRRL